MTKVNPNQPATKGMLDEAVDAILEGMNNLYTKHDQRFDKVDKRLDKIEGDVYFIKRNVKDIKIELVDIPTKKEFGDLKRKVDTLQV
ncbi:MAG: hypothetical protein Q8L28_01440 [bacterium]|nr:hypothetical protein [bacterium]